MDLVKDSGGNDFVEAHPRKSSSSLSSSSSSPSMSTSNILEAKLEKDAKAQSSSVGLPVSPLVQGMDRLGGYDPNRIPSSVFERTNPNAPTEWSSASNESLFSIHIGQNSFSVYGDPTKTDDLFKSGELLAYSPSPPLLPPSIEATSKLDNSDQKSEESEPQGQNENEGNRGQPTGVSWKSPTINAAEPGHDANPLKSQNDSTRSDRSTNSTHSFSFPILAEGVASEPDKPEAVEQKIQQAPEAKPNLSTNSWFSCFARCSWCFPSSRSGSCS